MLYDSLIIDVPLNQNVSVLALFIKVPEIAVKSDSL